MNPHQIYIVLTPEFEGYFNGKSLPAYGRMGKVTKTTETKITIDSWCKNLLMLNFDMMTIKNGEDYVVFAGFPH